MKTSLPLCRLVVAFLIALSSPPAQAQVAGPGSALSLDGATGYIQVTNGVWFSGNFTVEGWVFVRSYNNWSRLFDFGNAGYLQEVYLALSESTTGFPKMGVFTNGNFNLVGSSQQLPLNQWTHLAVTLNGTTASIFLNGNPVGSGTVLVPNNVVRTNNYIGRSNFAGDAYANAIFDEVRIWNVARTQGQIQADLHRSLVGNEPGLIGYWRMDEGSGTTLADSSGLGQTATLLGGTAWTNSNAPLMAGGGSALDFNSAVPQWVNIPHQPALNAYPLTVMTWFKSPATNSSGGLVNKYVSSSYNGYQLFMSGGHLLGWYFEDSADNVYNGGPMDAGPVNDGLWHHAAMVIDAFGGRLYLDGVQRSSLPWSGTPGPATTTQPLSFGLYPGDSFWSGQLDEVSIWNTALSSNQIQAAMNHPLAGTETGLIGYWRLDEDSGTNTADASANANNGALMGNPTWVASGAPLVVHDPGYGLHFNGASSYVDIPGFANVTPTTEVTIEFWQRAPSLAAQSILSSSPDNPTNRINIQGPYYDATMCWEFGQINIGGRLCYTPPVPIVGTWQHFAFVASQSANSMSIYRNGVLEAQKTGMTPLLPGNQHLILGSILTYGQFYGGDLDEVRIWNVARTATQIQQNIIRPLTGTEPGLVAYYRLDEGTGTNLVDATGNGHYGTLTNSPTWVVASEPPTGVILLGGNITTSGGQVYASPVILTNNTVLTSTGGGAIIFYSTVDGPYSLTINTAGTTAFNGTVGGVTALVSLTTDAAGTTALNGGSVTTTGSQTYGDTITLGAGTTLTSTGAGNITFSNTIDGAFGLTVNTAGATAFNGPIGGSAALVSLATDAAGTTLLNGGSVRTTGSQTYGDAIALGASTTLTSTGAGNITIANTVNGAFGLTMNTAGTTSFNGTVGGLTALTSLTTGAAGTTMFNGGSVTTTGSQTYGDAVQFGFNTLTLTSTGGGNITFNAIGGGGLLAVNTAGTMVFNGSIFLNGGALTTSAGPTLLNGGSVTTGLAQSYGGTITLGARTTLHSGAGNITFANTIDGAFDLTVTAAATTFNGAVGGFTPLASLTIKGYGTYLNGGSVSTTGFQSYGNAISLGANTTLTSIGAGNITFTNTVDGAVGLTVNTAGTTSFYGAVGGLRALASLTTDAAGSTVLIGGSVTTSGPQSYGDAVGFGPINTTVTSTGGGNITFANTVNGGGLLTVNTAGTMVFNGSIFLNGGALTTAAGPTLLNGGSVTTGGSQSYGGRITLGATTTLSSGGGNITFASTVDGAFGLTVNAANTTAFNGAVGGFTPLASLTIGNGYGPASLNGGSVSTSGSQTYNIPVALGADTTLTGGALSLLGFPAFPGNTLTGNNHALTFVNSAASVLNGSASGINPVVLNGSGLLAVNGTLLASLVTVNNGATLGGNGTSLGPVAVASGGTLSPGTSIGTLTISNSLSLAGTALMELNKAVGTNDQVRGITLLSYGGTLWVTNLNGTLAAGDSFKLFQAATYGGAFVNFVLPPLQNGLVWDHSRLAADGTIAVIQPGPSRITAIKLVAPQTIQLAGTGVASQVYYIWASTNLSLSQWWLLGTTNSANSGFIGFTDLTATNDHRFYRLAQ